MQNTASPLLAPIKPETVSGVVKIVTVSHRGFAANDARVHRGCSECSYDVASDEIDYNYFRYYDPSTGRYTQSDPTGLSDGPNTYAYVGNNPLGYFDPDGLSKRAATTAQPTPTWARPLAKIGGSLVRQIQRYQPSFTYPTASSNGVRFNGRDVRRLEEILNRNEQSGVCPSPLNYSPLGAGRRGAFREAKRGEGIPVSQSPAIVRPNYDRNGNLQLGREYIFGRGSNERSIREDAGGHFFGTGNNQNRGSHFNGSNNTHYDY